MKKVQEKDPLMSFVVMCECGEIGIIHYDRSNEQTTYESDHADHFFTKEWITEAYWRGQFEIIGEF